MNNDLPNSPMFSSAKVSRYTVSHSSQYSLATQTGASYVVTIYKYLSILHCCVICVTGAEGTTEIWQPTELNSSDYTTYIKKSNSSREY